MPYAHTKKLIPRELDKRVKISDEKVEEIKTLYTFERLAIREITRRVNVSRRAVQFILFPERLLLVKKQYAERRKDGRYKPERKEWAKTQRKHRHYKQSIKDKLITK